MKEKYLAGVSGRCKTGRVSPVFARGKSSAFDSRLPTQTRQTEGCVSDHSDAIIL